MPEDTIAFYAALSPVMASTISQWEAATIMGQEPPGEEVSDADRMNWWIEASCRIRLKYAETIVRLRSE
ncbi:hypothetical protein [Flavobacterium sp.]|jgi:hypothetical protein|uniref:hypothetical protein n=1 Tax=Flavobacterium sp. TaxID=239 RepID=UPI0037BE9ACF